MYWFKLCSFPTNNLSKAKNIAKHMMSDRPSNFSEVELNKKENNYHAYAYDKKSIKNLVKNLNLENPKIYFANQLHLNEIVAIDKNTMLYQFNERIMESPVGDKKPKVELKSNYAKLLKDEKPLKGFEKNVNKSNVFLAASLILFFIYIVLFSVDKIKTINSIDEQLLSLKTNDRSFYEIKSLIKKYKKLDKSSQKLKKELKNALKQNNIKKLEFKNDSIKVVNND